MLAVNWLSRFFVTGCPSIKNDVDPRADSNLFSATFPQELHKSAGSAFLSASWV
jgi:hypothetical protein